mgnify:CR=1 FL=1
MKRLACIAVALGLLALATLLVLRDSRQEGTGVDPAGGAEPAWVSAPEPAASTLHVARPAAADFVDESACAGCHAAEAEAWRGTDHDLAMQAASEGTVLGDFSGVQLQGVQFHGVRFQDGATDVLFTRDERGFAVETEGPDGQRARFDVAHVFGVDPLQQVLLPLPRGRLQALSVAWDTRAQRWFSLHPGERIDARDPLHWTRPPYNWNFACAECHATDLERGYDLASDTYATTWHRLDVGCQACHGPGARHVEWALANLAEDAGTDEAPPGRGFDAPLAVANSSVEVEACARCHARRAPLGDGFDHRNRLLDDYLPALLTAGLYHADGQILDEVYEYGSFLQSKMHLRGLRCSDCHEPHSLRLRQEGNLLCTGCHSPTPAARAHVDLAQLVRKNYDTPEHHHHAPGTSGARCVECHMPARTYMGVDPRRDHGFRVPRPDLAAETGAPDACTACHAQRDAAWAATEIARWSGPVQRAVHFGVALQAGRTGRSSAADALLALAASREAPIVRATALVELARYPSQAALEAWVRALTDPDGLVRHAALAGIEQLDPAQRAPLVAPLASDPLRALRAEAARLLAGLEPAALGPHAEAVRRAEEEYVEIQRGLAERPEAHLNLAQLHLARNEHAEAEQELRQALRLDPLFVPSYVNLADLARSTKAESEAEGVLRDGLGRVPDSAALQHALGLALVRQQRTSEGLAALGRAAELAPDEPRFAYVHAVALHDLGRPDEARAVLARLLARAPGERDARFALAGYLEEVGDAAGARRVLAELAAINPHDPDLARAVAPEQGGR